MIKHIFNVLHKYNSNPTTIIYIWNFFLGIYISGFRMIWIYCIHYIYFCDEARCSRCSLKLVNAPKWTPSDAIVMNNVHCLCDRAALIPVAREDAAIRYIWSVGVFRKHKFSRIDTRFFVGFTEYIWYIFIDRVMCKADEMVGILLWWNSKPEIRGDKNTGFHMWLQYC